MKYFEEEIILCDCYSPDHQMVVLYDKEEKMVFLRVHLAPRSFWGRVWYGIKYICGYRSRYGNWDEFILNPGDADKITKIEQTLRGLNNI